MKKNMKVLFINTNDIHGGAAKSTYRLHKGLQNLGIDSKILVQIKNSDDFSMISAESRFLKLFEKLRPTIDLMPQWIYRKRDRGVPWGISWFPNNIASKIEAIDPDIVHLNWISLGFVPIPEIAKIRTPIVWTLHDSWAFTGGCHLPSGCKNYEKNCGYCPILGSSRPLDLSRHTWNRKYKFWKNLDMTIITPSKWLYGCAKNSSLFRDLNIKIIPSSMVDTSIFKPIDKKIARRILKLAEKKKYILFGAINFLKDKNKGFDHLNSAIRNLTARGLTKDTELLIFGSSEPVRSPSIGIKIHYMGILHDDFTIALLFSAADVLCIPSIQETFPMTAVEAFACGTPVVAFNSTGITDIIDHKKNGYLAEPFKTEDLANGINWVLENKNRYNKMSRNDRNKLLEKYRTEVIARAFKKLYKNLIDEHKTKN